MLLGCALALGAGVLRSQTPFRQYPQIERDEDSGALPPDYRKPGDFILGRLMYPPNELGSRFGSDDWKHGDSAWTIDYPDGDRNFLRVLRRLTTIDARSVEQPVDPDNPRDIFYYPFLYATFPGGMGLTDSQIGRLREYLLRGGFLLLDCFFGTREWASFEPNLTRLFPNRPALELSNNNPIFHTVYDLTNRVQVANARALRYRGVGYRSDGAVPHWFAIRDDHRRIMVMILFNNDLGDGWENADDPTYPQQDASLAMRLGVNVVIYDMTH